MSNPDHESEQRTGVLFALTAYTVSRLGNELFAVWAIMLVMINYASVVHMGSGTSFAKFIAEFVASKDRQSLSGKNGGSMTRSISSRPFRRCGASVRAQFQRPN